MMNGFTKQLLEKFNSKHSEKIVFTRYPNYEFVNEIPIVGEGTVGRLGYLILWNHSELEMLNDEYMVSEFVDDIFLIGSNGSDTAFGVNSDRKYVMVPFIGMGNDTKRVIANTFDEFIKYVSEMDF